MRSLCTTVSRRRKRQWCSASLFDKKKAYYFDRCCSDGAINVFRSLSSLSLPSSSSDAVIHRQGSLPYGSRQYLLLPPHVTLSDMQQQDGSAKRLILASLYAHRNILFGARITNSTSTENSAFSRHRLTDACLPLVHAAIQDASDHGEQPQALSTLHGLCDWVVRCLDDDNGGDDADSTSTMIVRSKTLDQLEQKVNGEDASLSSSVDAQRTLNAIRAMATGSTAAVGGGLGLWRDDDNPADTWKALAKEYCHEQEKWLLLATTTTDNSNAAPDHEYALYLKAGGILVGIEHLADQSPSYLKSAGGAMARLYFA